MSANTENISLIPAAESDTELIEEIYFFTRNEEFAMLGWSDQQLRLFLKMQCEMQMKSYRMYYPSAEFSMILLDEKKVGRIIIERAETELRLVDIAVLPQFRGKGIGSKLIENLYSEAKEKRQPLCLQVEKNNIKAFRLYEKLGFKVTGESEIYISMEKI